MNPDAVRSASRPRVLLAVPASGAYGRQVAEGVGAYVHEHAQWDVIFHRSAGVASIEMVHRFSPIDGIITRRSGFASELLGETNRPPVVFVEEADEQVAQVYPDDFLIGRMAGEYLANRGLKSLAYIGQPGTHYSDRRLAGLWSIAEERSLAASEAPFSVRDSSRQEKLRQWLSNLPRPTGLLVISSFPGQAVLEECYHLGVRVPEDLAVLAVENDEIFCDLCCPSLSAIDHNARRIGYEAAGMLDRLMKGQLPEPTRLAVPPKGVAERASTELLAAENPFVARAVAFIRDHLEEGIGAAQVHAHVRCGRRTLEQAFRRYLDCCIEDHIRRTRIEKARHLLTETTYTLTEIAVRCGLSGSAQLCRIFRRLVGTTPGRYRREHSLMS